MSEEVCSCEKVAHGELGVIEPDESVARVVCNPCHIAADGSIKTGVFPPKHIATTGLSLMRLKHLSEQELRKHADDIAAHKPEDVAAGVIGGRVASIRSLVDRDGVRSVCVFDDPVFGEENLRDNPAHALLIAATKSAVDDVAEIRTKLLKQIFGPLRRFGDPDLG